MKVVVVPTNRPDSIQAWLHAWADCADWDQTVVVVDGLEPLSLDVPKSMRVQQLCWQDYECVGERQWIFSKRDSACRSFGFWWACQMAHADFIATLDDDCFPVWGDWFARHVRNLTEYPRWVPTTPDVRPRGLPYLSTGVRDDVKISVGLWDGVPDLDSVNGLSSPVDDYQSPDDITVWANGEYRPMCGMNLCFEAEATPLMYFPLMGEGWPYRRFDDIWCGVIAKHSCDALGWRMCSGHPSIRHVRASDPLANLVKEAPGIAENERFWQLIDAIEVDASSPCNAMRSIGAALATHDGYYGSLGKAITDWASLFGSKA